jgi:hypothetical protein
VTRPKAQDPTVAIHLQKLVVPAEFACRYARNAEPWVLRYRHAADTRHISCHRFGAGQVLPPDHTSQPSNLARRRPVTTLTPSADDQSDSNAIPPRATGPDPPSTTLGPFSPLPWAVTLGAGMLASQIKPITDLLQQGDFIKAILHTGATILIVFMIVGAGWILSQISHR